MNTPSPFREPEETLRGRIHDLIDAGLSGIRYPDEAAVSGLVDDIIRAMREPTQAMLDIGHDELIQGGDIKSAWALMTDAALK